ncbi:MAG: phosphomannose isomerase type II C-terminal cupin domain [bacterium]|nr:phosphomannose isomerase type II C-terminal cupin domain [bacterium]
MENLNIQNDERPWGNFKQFTANTPSTVKIITVNPNESLSLQSHNQREEFWYVLKGEGIFEINDVVYDVVEGDEYYVKLGEKHRISAEENGMQVLEIAFGNFNEEDIIRYEDKYGRS